MAAETESLSSLGRIMAPAEEKIAGQYLEIETGLRIAERYWRLGFLALLGVIVVLLVERITFDRRIADLKPIVVQVDSNGRATAAPYSSLAYTPGEREAKFFLGRFVKLHYSRIRATIADDFKEKLFFLEQTHADAISEDNRRNKTVENFLMGTDDQTDIHIRQIVIEDITHKPFKATVEFDKIYSAANDLFGKEKKRERFTAIFRFTILDQVPNEYILVNPLGFSITDFHESQGF
jgi:type IV secretory pathway TrbF-like protein